MIVCPIGFVADHIEVVWDLDHELRQQAQEPGIAFARAATPNADPRFARLVADLIDELRLTVANRPGCLARMPRRCKAFRSTARLHAELRLVRCQAECRIALTAAIRADRTTAGQRPQRVAGDLHLR